MSDQEDAAIRPGSDSRRWKGPDRRASPVLLGTTRRSVYIDAARRVLSESGRGGLTLRAIAREAGVTAAALYRHFEDLDALVAELSVELWDTLASEMREAELRARGEAPLEQLIAVLNAYVSFATSHPRFYELLFTPQPPGRFTQGATTPTRPVYLVIEDTLRACRRAGFTPRPSLPVREDLRQGADPDAVLLFSLAHGRVALAAASQVSPFSDPVSSLQFVRDVVLELFVPSNEHSLHPGRTEPCN